MVVTPNTNVAKRGVVIGFAINLGRGLGKFLVGKNLNRSFGLLATNTEVVGTPQMVFINPIMAIHVHRTTYKPLMNSIDVGGYINTYAKDSKGEY